MTLTAAKFPSPFPLLVMLLALLWAAPSAHASKCEAQGFIVSAGRAYDQAARAGTASAFANGVARYSDMNAIAMFALGSYRKLLPRAREAEYVALTRKFMGAFMLENGKNFRVGNLEVVTCTGSPSNMTVTARTADGKKVSFRIYRAGGSWLVRDMNVSGIWLVQQMRATFVGTIKRNDERIEALFTYLNR